MKEENIAKRHRHTMQRSIVEWIASLSLVALLSVVAVADLQAAPFAYIPNYNDGTVSVIDTATNTVTATVPAPGGNPGNVAVHPDGTSVYITYQHTTLRVIDTATNTFIATLPLGGPNVAGIAVSPDGTRVYAVANHYVYGVGAIAVIDTATNTEILPRVTVGGGPNGVAVSPDGTRVYVANQYSGTVSVIDTTTTPNAVIATVTVGLGSGWPVADANGVAVSPDGNVLAHRPPGCRRNFLPMASSSKKRAPQEWHL
jgi:YVTN family beta-propeller protein